MNISILCSRLVRLSLASIAVCFIGFTGTTSAGDVNTLYKAAGAGDSTQVSALLDGGVDVNARTGNGSFVLNNAAVENEIDVIRILLERGANPNVQNGQGDTPLICATKYAGGEATTVKLLVEAGTDKTIQDDDGKTALDYAKAKEQKEAIAFLN